MFLTNHGKIGRAVILIYETIRSDPIVNNRIVYIRFEAVHQCFAFLLDFAQIDLLKFISH